MVPLVVQLALAWGSEDGSHLEHFCLLDMLAGAVLGRLDRGSWPLGEEGYQGWARFIGYPQG